MTSFRDALWRHSKFSILGWSKKNNRKWQYIIFRLWRYQWRQPYSTYLEFLEYLFDFGPTHEISTPVISNFSKGWHWYQKMQNFSAHLLIYGKTLPHHAPVLKRLRKSSKANFPLFVPRELVQVWYHFKSFLKLYNLSYSDSTYMHWV